MRKPAVLFALAVLSAAHAAQTDRAVPAPNRVVWECGSKLRPCEPAGIRPAPPALWWAPSCSRCATPAHVRHLRVNF